MELKRRNSKIKKGNIKMDILEKAHELGEMIKNSPEMKAMVEAEEVQKNDEAAITLLQEYNLKRMNLSRELQQGKIEQAEAIVKNNEYFSEMVKKSETIENFVKTKQAFDEMVQKINQVLNYYITGQDSNCTHDCSTCGGCH